VGVALALIASVTYGAADFLGGMASRRTPPVTVVLWSQIAGFAILAVVLPFGGGRLDDSAVVWGVASGVAGAVAIACLYAALARGRMGVVSPISAVIGASVPVAVGLAFGGRPAPIALAGIGLAFVAVALVSTTGKLRGVSFREPAVPLAVASGIAIGALFVFLSRGGAADRLWLLGVARITSVALLFAYGYATRANLRPLRGAVRTIVIAGALDMSANVLYVLSTRVTLLAVSAVLTSLYPASTVFLARFALHERLTRTQWAGVACAIAGAVLIALPR
jgi:drug/metabolite transporter (DMT)-like permease